MFTGREHGSPVFTAALPTARVHGFTNRVNGPCSRVMWTGAREHGPQTRPVNCTAPYGQCTLPVFTRAVDEHGP